MSLKEVGYFRELDYGNADGPSLLELRGRGSRPEEGRIVQYLRAGSSLMASPTLVGDALDQSKDVLIPLEILTDGIWSWPSDLAYYVENYHVELPADFVRHMQEQDWQPPVLSHEALVALDPPNDEE